MQRPFWRNSRNSVMKCQRCNNYGIRLNSLGFSLGRGCLTLLNYDSRQWGLLGQGKPTYSLFYSVCSLSCCCCFFFGGGGYVLNTFLNVSPRQINEGKPAAFSLAASLSFGTSHSTMSARQCNNQLILANLRLFPRKSTTS